MSKLRLAILGIATGATFLGAVGPGEALVGDQTAIERTVTTAFHFGELGDRIEVGIEAVDSDAVSPGSSLSQACITIERPAVPLQTLCGPAEVEVDPLLERAHVTGSISGIDFAIDFVARSLAMPAIDAGGGWTASVGFTRSGTAIALIRGLVNNTETRGSSWYAEAKEKVKTSADPN